MSTQKSNLSKLIVFDTPPAPANQNEPPNNFMRDMLRYPDAKLAAQLVAEHTGLEFDEKHGGDIACLTHNLNEQDKQNNKYKDQLNECEQKLKNTPQYIKFVQTENETSENKAKIKIKDLALLFAMLISAIVCMVMGASNVYANLMASGEPIFLEKSWLAVSLSMLMPMAAMPLKFLSEFFEYASTKKKYSLFVYGLTALLIMAWTVLFSLNFSGVAGGIDWDSIGSKNSTGSALVWVQLFCEILISVALFLAIDDILLKYSPTTYTENIAYLNVKKSDEILRTECEKLREKRNKTLLKLTMLEKERDKRIIEKVAAFHAIRSRRQSEINL